MEKPDKLREREICRSFHRSLKAPYFSEAAMGAKAGPEKGAKWRLLSLPLIVKRESAYMKWVSL